MVKGDWVKDGAVVIDVGINRLPAPEKGEGKTKLVGDVDFEEAKNIGKGGRGEDPERFILGFDEIWSRIRKNQGKSFKTKTGKKFSYKVKDEKIEPAYIIMKNKKDVVYGYGPPINKLHVEEAYWRIRRGSAPNVTDLSDIVYWPTHLWGILHDKRISKGEW